MSHRIRLLGGPKDGEEYAVNILPLTFRIPRISSMVYPGPAIVADSYVRTDRIDRDGAVVYALVAQEPRQAS